MLVSSARATARRQAAAAAEQAEQAATAGDRYDTAKAALTARVPDFEVAHSGQLGYVHAYAAGQAVIDYRDRGDLERAVDDYDYATRRRFLPRLLGSNRYPDRCAACQQRVAAGAGVRGDLPDRYLTWCAAHVPTETRDR